MNKTEVLNKIAQVVAAITAAKGMPAPEITPATLLLGGGLIIDSLDLAGLIVELESATGVDPFRQSYAAWSFGHGMRRRWRGEFSYERHRRLSHGPNHSGGWRHQLLRISRQ